MCGIAGVLDFSGQGVNLDRIERMTRLLSHRGPDDQGLAFFDITGKCAWQGKELVADLPRPDLALGHRRLSIIDLTDMGHQPMACHKQQLWITYNGEIYNYIELRQQLMDLGHQFKTHCDTEVILKAYLQWGRECVTRFNGMWAFAIWDCQHQKLFCSRDRFGIKPFYFCKSEKQFSFASEIKSVLASLDSSQHNINQPYMTRFILDGLLNDSDQTMFEDIFQLLPAHCLEVENGKINLWRYWQLPPEKIQHANQCDTDYQQAVEQFRDLLTDAVKLRFRADVPVGTNLSGGLDSSTVVSLATKALESKISTFTVEYDEREFSEGHFARTLTQHCQTDAHFITPSPDQYIEFIEKFSWYHDEPCVGSGMFSQWHVMQLASQHVKVVLDGQGADELLGGYTHYHDHYLSTLLVRSLNTDSNETWKRFVEDFKLIAQHHEQSSSKEGLRFIKHLADHKLPGDILSAIKPFYRLLKQTVTQNKMLDVVDRAILSHVGSLKTKRSEQFQDDLNNILYDDLTRDNLPMLLQNGDRISMAFSIESRLPFLDYRLVEFCNGLPYDFKMKGATTKRILRDVMCGYLPEQIINRTDKKGFPTPFAVWLKGPLKEYAMDTFNSQSFTSRGIFKKVEIKKIVQQHEKGLMDHSWLIWRMLNFETWMKLYQDNFNQHSGQHM